MVITVIALLALIIVVGVMARKNQEDTYDRTSNPSAD